ncbi:Copia protein [Senna tora]|uniref:Copia protein n=1 Tax=Senna tora TaxID=362788 RepID=A0A834TNF9_9FABA|nr:Copia protein [Senna tora]
MSSSSAASESSVVSSVKSSSLFNAPSQANTTKLDRSNYMVWEAVILPLIIGNRLRSHIDSKSTPPPTHLVVGFLNRRVPSSSNDCILPFMPHVAGPRNTSVSVSRAPLNNSTTTLSQTSAARATTVRCNIDEVNSNFSSRDGDSDSRATTNVGSPDVGRSTGSEQPVNDELSDGPSSNTCGESESSSGQPHMTQHAMVTRSRAEFTRRLNSAFALEDLGSLYYFLGIEVRRDQTGRKFVANDGEKMANPSLYGRAIGSLQYLTTTQPDIAFSVIKYVLALE